MSAHFSQPRKVEIRGLSSTLWRSSVSSLGKGLSVNKVCARLAVILLLCLVTGMSVLAQQTNPVDRQVTNPITDTPNVNPLTQEQPIRPQLPAQRGEGVQSTEELTVTAGKQTITGAKDA